MTTNTTTVAGPAQLYHVETPWGVLNVLADDREGALRAARWHGGQDPAKVRRFYRATQQK